MTSLELCQEHRLQLTHPVCPAHSSLLYELSIISGDLHHEPFSGRLINIVFAVQAVFTTRFNAFNCKSREYYLQTRVNLSKTLCTSLQTCGSGRINYRPGCPYYHRLARCPKNMYTLWITKFVIAIQAIQLLFIDKLCDTQRYMWDAMSFGHPAVRCRLLMVWYTWLKSSYCSCIFRFKPFEHRFDKNKTQIRK